MPDRFASDRHQGSRGHLLDLLDRDGWRDELNQLISTAGAFVGPDSIHVPVDTASPAEWSLARFCKTHCTADMDAGRFDGWWVKAGSPPTWDLIATCAIDGHPGLLIVEAKAHEGEIHRDGKLHPLEGLKGTPDERLRRGARSLINHGYIGRCIHEARDGLRQFVHSISIDRDWNYQLTNRIASAWKFAECRSCCFTWDSLATEAWPR